MRDGLTIGDDIELPGPAGREHDIDSEALLDEGGETRSLGLVILSSWTVVDLGLHLGSRRI